MGHRAVKMKGDSAMSMTRRSLLAMGGAVAGLPARGLGKDLEKPARGPRSRYFPNVPLWTQDNKKVRFYDDLIGGKIVVINFFYARCEKLCPKQTANLVKVQKLLGDRVGRDIFMYSITLDPKH